MKNFLFLFKREFGLFWQNNILRMLFIGAPLLYAILLGYVYSKGKVTDLPILVVDLDQSEMSAKAIEMFNDDEVINVAKVLYDQNNLSDHVIELEANSVVIIPKGFQKMVFTKKYPEITTIVNTANILTANYASTAIQVCLGTLKAGVQMETLRKQGIPEKAISSQYEPFKTTFIKKFNRSTNYMYYLWPGVLAAVLQQVMLLALALSFASEFENGTFSFLVQKSNSIIQMMVIKILPYLIMSFGVWLMYWFFTFYFRIPFFTNLPELTLVAGIFILSVSFIGILVSILIPSQLKATEILMVIATPSFILSGFSWPLSQMPNWVQGVANVIPLTHFLKAFRTLIIEEGSLYQVRSSIINMIIIGLVCSILSFIALYFKSKKVTQAES
ncbi:ABC-2 type transport system permease protein [Flavobacterium succinicans]|jgi:ABC-2 type transport system permease protein|uniref:ABC-2 type transport system permease protein n=1 Tax=Flavobacterium succinicans TaxID=29536 RepID=A0A1I4X484_9FLAO|nr:MULTISPECIES: ABC transporter permease [Flavobacterium]OOV27727.1 ABC transporter permease [Flavobacterium sp. LM5]SFN20821.1 ABC-2 type transport system permease protein [Flavobacterium succinicans]